MNQVQDYCHIKTPRFISQIITQDLCGLRLQHYHSFNSFPKRRVLSRVGSNGGIPEVRRIAIRCDGEFLLAIEKFRLALVRKRKGPPLIYTTVQLYWIVHEARRVVLSHHG